MGGLVYITLNKEITTTQGSTNKVVNDSFVVLKRQCSGQLWSLSTEQGYFLLTYSDTEGEIYCVTPSAREPQLNEEVLVVN